MKKIHLNILSNELKSVQTYQKVNIFEMEIFVSNYSFSNKHGIKLEDNFKHLPTIHWLPKVLKIPFKYRYIVNSRYCFNK